MVTIVEGNLLEIETGIICHQVNCRRVAGAGLANQIANKWPEWKTSYEMAKQAYLGLVGWYRVSDDLWIANLYAQDNFGRNRRHTNYAALGKCLFDVRRTVDHTKAEIYLPKGIGCGLGGGDWQIVYQIIEDALPHAIIVEFTAPKTYALAC